MLKHILALAAGLALVSAPALAENDDLVIKSSPHGVSETLDRLSEVVEENGARVFARIDHAAGAAAIDEDMPPMEVLIFGNPKMGTPLIQEAPEVGLDLPVRVLVWEDSSGNTRVAYLEPEELADRYDIDEDSEAVQNMEKALDNLTGAAISQ
ncbi:DUF302 domain-containing protein [Fodinicurvata halophila]|uniref:DUF302 domain-containing protein n=1 Tax=Fodinicurvata halophila TaxID=1419723 RepID=A0ABV8UN14_9PROT